MKLKLLYSLYIFQKRFFKLSVLFFKEQPFYNFPGGSIILSCIPVLFKKFAVGGLIICSSNRHVFSRKVYLLFVEQTLLSHQTDTNFPRNTYLVLKHIFNFQEALSSPRTHIIFQEGTDILLLGLVAASKINSFMFLMYSVSVYICHFFGNRNQAAWHFRYFLYAFCLPS